MDSSAAILDTWKDRADSAPEEKREEESVRQRILSSRFRTLFGKRFREKTFDTYQVYGPEAQRNWMESCARACRQYAENLGKALSGGLGLVLVGNSGTGKNHLVYAIAREVVKADYKLEVRTFLELMGEIRTCWDFHVQKEQEIIDRYVSVDFLILEEIGIQFGSPTEKIYLFEIIDQRYKAAKPTILTSNLTEREFREYIDFDGKQRIWDRLYETAIVLHFNWPSYRQTAAGKKASQASGR